MNLISTINSFSCKQSKNKRNNCVIISNYSNPKINIFNYLVLERPPWLRRPLPPGNDDEEEEEEDEEEEDEEDEGSAKGSLKSLKIEYDTLLGIYIHECGTILCASKLLWVHSDLKLKKIFRKFL